MTVSPHIKQHMGPLEWAMLITLSIVWGASFFTVGIAVKELPPLTIVLARVGLGALGLWAIVWAMGVRVPKRGDVWLRFFGMGLLNNAIPFALIVWGQQHIASGLASIINAATPFFTILVANALTDDERMTGAKVAGVLIGLAGVAWMIGGAAFAGLGQAVWAQLAIVGAAISYAFAGVYGRRFRRMGLDPIATATGQVTCSALVLAPAAMLVDKPWALAPPGMATWWALIVLALVSTSLAYVLYFRILERAGATNLLLVTLLIPPSAILFGVAFLDEVLLGRHLGGLAVIALGLALIDGRLFTRHTRRKLPPAA